MVVGITTITKLVAVVAGLRTREAFQCGSPPGPKPGDPTATGPRHLKDEPEEGTEFPRPEPNVCPSTKVPTPVGTVHPFKMAFAMCLRSMISVGVSSASGLEPKSSKLAERMVPWWTASKDLRSSVLVVQVSVFRLSRCASSTYVCDNHLLPLSADAKPQTGPKPVNPEPDSVRLNRSYHWLGPFSSSARERSVRLI